MVRAGILVMAVGLGAVLDAGRHSEAGSGDLRRLAGVTGQRRAIEFRVNNDGRPRSFVTGLYSP